MDLPTQTHLTTLRNLLNDRLRELGGEVRDAAAQHVSTDAGGHEVVDRKDEAAQQQFADQDDAQEQRDLDEMDDVRAALQRLDEGSYGNCIDCAEPIALQRLLVQPAALRCAPCQAAHERAADRSGPRRATK